MERSFSKGQGSYSRAGAPGDVAGKFMWMVSHTHLCAVRRRPWANVQRRRALDHWPNPGQLAMLFKSDLKGGDRLIINGTAYEIKGKPENVEGRGRYCVLTLEEIEGGA